MRKPHVLKNINGVLASVQRTVDGWKASIKKPELDEEISIDGLSNAQMMIIEKENVKIRNRNEVKTKRWESDKLEKEKEIKEFSKLFESLKNDIQKTMKVYEGSVLDGSEKEEA